MVSRRALLVLQFIRLSLVCQGKRRFSAFLVEHKYDRAESASIGRFRILY